LDALGSSPRQLTNGPADFTPAWRPDERAIAFAAPVKGRGDTDLFWVPTGGGERRALLDEPLSDETGPVFSRDGRFLFATSVYRSVADGAPVLASLVVLPLTERKPVLRALHDPVASDTRLGAAVGPGALDAERLRSNLPYAVALRQTMRREMQLRRESDPPTR
jgi:hypothetical protein